MGPEAGAKEPEEEWVILFSEEVWESETPL